MVFDELFLLSWRHCSKRVVLASELALEFAACLDNLFLDLVSLSFGDSWPKREVGKVAADSDPSTADHFGVLWIEGWAFQVRSIHVALMASAQLEFVVVLKERCEKWGELLI